MAAAAREQDPPGALIEERPLRLNRFLAASGVASRRAAEALIAAGRVTVNDTVATHPGLRVQPRRDIVRVDGDEVRLVQRPTYLLLYKPTGVLTASSDTRGRATVIDLLPPDARRARLYPVGRLDRDSEGLVLLTDDGTLTHRLLHPRYHVVKRYRVWTRPRPTKPAIDALARGVEIASNVRTRPATVRLAGRGSFVIELREGRKRQIRRMCEAIGLVVERLVRIGFGPLGIGRLRPGHMRALARPEIESLWDAAGLVRDRLRQ